LEDDMLEYVTLRTKNLGQEALSADNVRDDARAKAVRSSYEFWSTGDEALLERAFAETSAEHLVGPPCEPAANSLRPSGAAGRRK
jgi:membrane-bound inhibitor of C-type lysozyme